MTLPAPLDFLTYLLWGCTKPRHRRGRGVQREAAIRAHSAWGARMDDALTLALDIVITAMRGVSSVVHDPLCPHFRTSAPVRR